MLQWQVLPKVFLFGEPKALVNQKEYRFQASRRYQLLAYLAYAGARVSREQLADVFWSHTDSQAARRNLRKVLFEAKNLEWAVGFEQDEQAASWQLETDVAAFENACKEKNWSEAIALYSGNFLQGLQSNDGAEFDAWLEQERLRLEEMFQEAAENYAESLEQQGQFEEAINVLKGLLARESLNERFHYRVMRLEYKRGNTEAALAQFERCREILQQELGVEPLPETLELLRSIEQGGTSQSKSAVLLKVPNDIPNAPETLLGREKVLQEALLRLTAGERVLLHGFGGMGKTALAAVVAKNWLEQHQPALWLQVGSDNPDVIYEALARAFEAQQEIAQAEDKTAFLKVLLQRQSLSLLILDDVWNAYTLSKVMDALPELPLLVTSRQRYPKLQRIYVDRLERSASHQLLQLHAQQELVFEEAEHLCELLGDHAFALRLAGIAMAEEQIGAGQLFERIKNAPHDFKMPGDFREVGRESVASLLSVSLEALEDRAYETFLTFGLLESPSASAEFLAQCLDRNLPQIEDALFLLVQRGLAERMSKAGSDLVSYRIHDLAHSYAKANRFQRTSTLIRSSLDFLKENKDDVDLLDTNIANLLAAVQLANEQGQEEKLLAAMRLLSVDGSYYLARGHTRKSVDLLNRAVAVAKREKKAEEAHLFASVLGDYYQHFLGDYERSLEFYQEALGMARMANDKGREAIYLGIIGQVNYILQREDAASYLDQAYQLAKTNQDDYYLIIVLGQMSYVAGLQGEMKRANQLLYESLAIMARLKQNDTRSEKIARHQFFALLNLGETEYELGHFDKALAVRQQALEIAEKQANQVWLGHAYQVIGEMYHKEGLLEQAHDNLSQALAFFEKNNAKKDAEAILAFLREGGYAAPASVSV